MKAVKTIKVLQVEVYIPPWAKFIAQNILGHWYCFEYAPVIDDVGGWDCLDGGSELLYVGVRNTDWEKSLRRV